MGLRHLPVIRDSGIVSGGGRGRKEDGEEERERRRKGGVEKGEGWTREEEGRGGRRRIGRKGKERKDIVTPKLSNVVCEFSIQNLSELYPPGKAVVVWLSCIHLVRLWWSG